MKNIEKYESEIVRLVTEGDDIVCSIATTAGIVKENSCSTRCCKECQKQCLEWMYSEYKEPILNDDEIDIIKSMIDVVQKLGYEVINVCKIDSGYDKYYVSIKYKNKLNGYIERVSTPWFENDKFKEMKVDKEYSIEELGIELEDSNGKYREIS